ncbi:MAG TPA: cyclic nucleotide-binding and patatin-like phospholipase domain-containing protein [Candidatus Cybelea sp.]|nr:cyclic nucleotide-binding and patatin-like phospholipase domain-containing protein [Candidatus Cybelea sp.]
MERDARRSANERRPELERLLGNVALFEGLDEAALSAICGELDWFALPGGAFLFRQNEPSDALYIVASGSLDATIELPDGTIHSAGRIGPGETAGEMGFLSGSPRTATLRALRDCELVRFDLGDFEALIHRHPTTMLKVARVVARRLEVAQSAKVGDAPMRSFALLPHNGATPVADVARCLAAAFGGLGRVVLIEREQGEARTSDWFAGVEAANDVALYVADADASPWTQLCLRQADCVLLVAHAHDAPSPWASLVRSGESGALHARIELLLLNNGEIRAGTERWLKLHAIDRHHHISGRADHDRIARVLAGQGMALVLSGGGARGFAHLGVVKALREAGIVIDMIGGNSMGAIIGAGVAAGWDDITLQARVKQAFVDTNPLSDFTLPFVSLVGGHKVSRLLRDAFGDATIEDLRLPFFCTSANLTRGAVAIHRDGLLWRWLRASVAIPGVLPPVFDHHEVFVDGGVINNLPVDVMRAGGRCRVIGVDVVSDHTFTADSDGPDLPPVWRLFRPWRDRKIPSLLQILWRAGTVNSDAAAIAAHAKADLLLQPPLASVDLLNWKAFDKAVDIGYRHTAEQLAKSPPGVLGSFVRV